MSFLNKLFGGNKNSSVNIDKGKSLYIQGRTKIDLLAVLLQSYSDSPHETIDSDMAHDILNQVIPNIDQCMREDIRIQQAKDYKKAIANSAHLPKEYENSDGTYITGMISAKQNDVPITIDITLLVNGIRSVTGNTGIIIMKTPTSWAANLKVM